MADPALESRLDKVVDQLKTIAKILDVSTGVSAKTGDYRKQQNISGPEKVKIEKTAAITALKFKQILGLGFNDKDSERNAKKFKIEFKPLFDNLSRNIKAVADSFNKNKSATVTGGFDIKKLINSLRWNEFRNTTFNFYIESIRINTEILSNLKKILNVSSTTKPKTKTLPTEGIGKMLGGIVGMAAIGIGLFLIISALKITNQINLVQVLKIIGVVGALIGLFILLTKVSGSIKNASLGFAALAATITFIIIPTMLKLTKIPFTSILEGLFKFSLIVGTCIGLMVLMNKIKKTNVLTATGGLVLLTGIMLFGLLPTFDVLSKQPIKQILEGLFKFSLIVGTCIGLMIMMSKIKKSNVLVTTLAMGAMVFLIGYLADQLGKFANKPWNAITEGLQIAGVAFGAFLGIFGIILLGVKKAGIINMGITTAIMGAMVFLVGYLADQLGKFANKDWNAIIEGLKIAGIAFGALFVMLGLLVLAADALGGGQGIVGAIALALIAGVLVALAYAVGLLADGLVKYSAVDPEKLKDVGLSMLVLAAGMTAMAVGTVVGVAGGIVGALASLFNIDPVSQIKKFEKIDSEKIYKIGIGMKSLAEGLQMLSGDISFKNITSDLIKFTQPLINFAGAIDKFSSSYTGLDKAIAESEFNTNYQMKLQSDNSIHTAILEVSKQELEIQTAQLEQLRQNGEYLRIISSREGSEGGVAMAGRVPEKVNTITSPSFNTKNSYLNNLKLATMSMQ